MMVPPVRLLVVPGLACSAVAHLVTTPRLPALMAGPLTAPARLGFTGPVGVLGAQRSVVAAVRPSGGLGAPCAAVVAALMAVTRWVVTAGMPVPTVATVVDRIGGSPRDLR